MLVVEDQLVFEFILYLLLMCCFMSPDCDDDEQRQNGTQGSMRFRRIPGSRMQRHLFTRTHHFNTESVFFFSLLIYRDCERRSFKLRETSLDATIKKEKKKLSVKANLLYWMIVARQCLLAQH